MKTKNFLFSRLEKQFLLCASNPAIIYNQVEVSYLELSSKVNLLANHLGKFSVKKNTLIAILLPKTPDHIVAAISILKAGAAYMPINVAESMERKISLLQQAGVTVVITTKSIANSLDGLANYTVILLDFFFDSKVFSVIDNEFSLRKNETDASDLAYVLFTSGSTGSPKGVMITHENAMNTIQDINKKFNVSRSDKVLALSSLDFDLSIYDIFGILSVGGAIVLPTESQMVDPREWLSLIYQYKITIWNSVPGFMEMLVRAIELYDQGEHFIYPSIQSLRLILLSGDWIPVQLPIKIHHHCPFAEIISLGGATEASIWSIFYPIDVSKIEKDWRSIPYGKPLKNQFFYILDEEMKPIYNHEEGELYIGGKGVGLGYWRDKVNTENNFLHHPIFGYLYKTGDKGKWLPDGNIEFLGRIGDQIKLRGFRIDLKAIEACIQSTRGVRRSIVKIIKNTEYSENLVLFVEEENIGEFLNKDDLFYKELVKQHLYHWSAIYNSFFENSGFIASPYFNTVGWVSSYTRKCISEKEMREWRDNTVARILDLNPKVVLEVGVGTGLILAEVAPKVAVYDVVDSSFESINYIEKYFNVYEEYRNVKCLEYDFSMLEKKYDTFILNSVAQYFPDIQYFEEILNSMIEKAVEGGRIFLGDIYNYDYLEDFYLSINLHHNSCSVNSLNLDFFLEQNIQNERQLYIHPDFFLQYAEKNSRVSHIEIQIKSGSYDNELNLFRYDVVLYLDQKDYAISSPLVLNGRDLSKISDLEKFFHDKKSEEILIKNLFNSRFSMLVNYKNNFIQDDIVMDSEGSNKKELCSFNPSHFYKLGQDIGYNVCCSWSLEKYHFDVAFYKKTNPLIYQCDKNKKTKYSSLIANSPLQYQFRRYTEDSIRKKISADLAPYMQPNNILFVKSIPFTGNGKVNHKMLLSLIARTSQGEELNESPASFLEKEVSEIFKRVLSSKKINLSKNFLEIGGDSLRMLEIIHDIEALFSVRLSFFDFMSNSSVKKLSNLLQNKCNIDANSLEYTED